MAKSTTQNDDVILTLKKQIEDKKKSLKASERFNPKTNCSLFINGERININVANKEALTVALITVNSLRLSAKDLKFNDFKFQGFDLQDWIDDLSARLAILDRTQEQARLKALEEKLHNLLSVEKKVELEIEDLKNQI